MAWRDQLRKASFKGVGFLVAGAEGSFGRSVVVHQFPKKSTAFAEDIGAKPSEFSVEAFVIGADYFAARDAMLSICQEEGPGDLVHPFLGKKYVVCTGITLKESTADGGIATFTLSFTETTAPVVPVSVEDYAGKLAAAAAQARATASAALEENFSVVGYATSVVDSAQDAVDTVVAEFDAIQKTIRKQLDEVADLSYKIRNLKADVAGIIAIPEKMAAQFDDTFLALAKAFGGGKDAAAALAYFAETAPEIAEILSSVALTASSEHSLENARAIDQFKKLMAAAYQAEALAEAEFETLDEAIENRDALIDSLEELKETVSDEVFQAIEDLRIAAIRAIPSQDQALARIVTHTTEQTLPSLVFAFDVYEDLEREEDLILRNALAHPGFIEAGSVLKVLQDG